MGAKLLAYALLILAQAYIDHAASQGRETYGKHVNRLQSSVLMLRRVHAWLYYRPSAYCSGK